MSKCHENDDCCQNEQKKGFVSYDNNYNFVDDILFEIGIRRPIDNANAVEYKNTTCIVSRIDCCNFLCLEFCTRRKRRPCVKHRRGRLTFETTFFFNETARNLYSPRVEACVFNEQILEDTGRRFISLISSLDHIWDYYFSDGRIRIAADVALDLYYDLLVECLVEFNALPPQQINRFVNNLFINWEVVFTPSEGYHL